MARKTFTSKSFIRGAGIEKVGDWDKLMRLTRGQTVAAMGAVKLGQHKAAEKYKKRVRYHIRTGGIKLGLLPPKSEIYQKQKSSYGFGNKALMFTHTLYNSIDIIVKGYKISVGVRKGRKRPMVPGKRNKLPVDEYANILEKGNANQVPRPIFSRTFKELGGVKFIRKSVIKQLGIIYRLFGV